MEVIRTVQSVIKILESVRGLMNEDKDLQRNLSNELEDIKGMLQLFSVIKNQMWAEMSEEGVKPAEWSLQLQEWAYEIEDFLEMRGKDPGKSSAPIRLVEVALVTDARPEHLLRIRGFRDRIRSILESKDQWQRTRSTLQQITPVPFIHRQVAYPLGLELDMDRIRQLLGQQNQFRVHSKKQNQFKVVSILGCSGLGKTTLAWALFNDQDVISHFPHRAWVQAPSSCDHNQVTTVIEEILQQVDHVGGDIINLQQFLRDKRYLVIIDGLEKTEIWDSISTRFPKNEEGSRVLVTTRNRSVASSCSYGGYLHTMCGLGNSHQEELFWRSFNQHALGRNNWLRTLVAKSDGLPLVMVAAAEYLRPHAHRLTEEQCNAVGNALGNHIASKMRGFERMRRALTQCCDSLPKHAHKMCMLHVTSFPRGHVIKRKSLMRRWSAEGLLVADDVNEDEESIARSCLNELLDLCIVEPVPRDDASINDEVKRCQLHGVMLELLLHRSLSWNFVTLIKDGRLVPTPATACAARRLSIHGVGIGQIDRAAEKIDLSRVRSLTVCNINNFMSLEKCKLLRVLDLEDCRWIVDEHLKVICGLLYLKYLSLRGTEIAEIPRNVRYLQCMETMDVQQTRVSKLPMEVFMLPKLAHLFGKFELPDELQRTKGADKLKEFFSNRSELHTLAGFKIVNNGGFEQILLHASNLKKVKIFCEIPPPPPTPPRGRYDSFIKHFKIKKINSINLFSSLFTSLKTRLTGSKALDYLAIDFGGDDCQIFLDSLLKDPCSVEYIKLRGQIERLPDRLALETLHNVKKLHLCNTGLRSEDLSVLQSIQCLVSLKLAENHADPWGGFFIVQIGGFPLLRMLCFKGPRLPQVEFRQGSMCALRSLQLICLHPANEEPGVEGLAHLEQLDEVILHPEASVPKVQAWEQEANNHINRPHVRRRNI